MHLLAILGYLVFMGLYWPVSLAYQLMTYWKHAYEQLLDDVCRWTL